MCTCATLLFARIVYNIRGNVSSFRAHELYNILHRDILRCPYHWRTFFTEEEFGIDTYLFVFQGTFVNHIDTYMLHQPIHTFLQLTPSVAIVRFFRKWPFCQMKRDGCGRFYRARDNREHPGYAVNYCFVCIKEG